MATQVRWIRALASLDEVAEVLVLTPRHGRADLPANVTVRVIPRGALAVRTLRTWREVLRWRRGRGLDLFYVAQGGRWPAMLLPLKVLLRRPIFQWKAQPHISRGQRFAARWCDDLVFTATAGSFPSGLENVRVVGHGIDTEQFRSTGAAIERDLVVVGRIAPSKRIEVVLTAVAAAEARLGRPLTLDLIGPVSGGDHGYRADLEAMATGLGMDGEIRFLGSIEHDDVATRLPTYRASLNFSDNAFDKAAGEAMAAGVPVVTTNGCAAEMLPEELRPSLVAGRDDPEAQVDRIVSVLRWSEDRRTEVGVELRATIEQGHSLRTHFTKVLAEIAAHTARSR